MAISTGERIKAIRILMGKTQADFAFSINKKLGSDGTVTRGTVNNWEHGRNLPNKRRLKSISDVANVSIDFLLNGTQMPIEDIKKFQSTLINRDNLTGEEKRRAKEISIETRLVAQSVNESFNKTSRQVFKDSFLVGLSPEARILANQISVLVGQISTSEVPESFLEDFTVYLGGITHLLSGSLSKKDFGEYQDALSKCIDKNFK